MAKDWFDPEYFYRKYFAVTSQEFVGGSSSINITPIGSLQIGFKGLVPLEINSNAILYISYSVNGISNLNIVSSGRLSDSSLRGNAKLEMGANGICEEPLTLDEELFNNDPDVMVNEYVLIFKRKQ